MYMYMYLLVSGSGSHCADIQKHLSVAVQWQDGAQWVLFLRHVQQTGWRSLDMSTSGSLSTTPLPALPADSIW